MTQPSTRRQRQKAGRAEVIEAGIRAFEAARGRLEDRQSESDGAAPAKQGDAPAEVATTTAAPPSPSDLKDPGFYEMPYGKFAGWRLRDIWFAEGGPEYVRSQLRFLSRTAPEALSAIETWLAFLRSGGAGASAEGSSPLDPSGPRRLLHDQNAPACVKARYGEAEGGRP